MRRRVLVKTSGASSNCKRGSHLHTRLQTCEGTRKEHPAAFYWLQEKKPSQKAPLQWAIPFIAVNLVADAEWSRQLIRNHLKKKKKEKLGGKLPRLKSEIKESLFSIMMSLSRSVHTPLAQFCHCFTLCRALGPFSGDEKEICSAGWILVHYLAALIAKLKCILLFILPG